MTSRYVIMARATSAGALVTCFASRPQQLPFTYANDGAGPVRNNRITDERN